MASAPCWCSPPRSARLLLPDPGRPAKQMELSLELVAVGFRFIWRRETILGAMLFEFMASLFGSVQALLPIYARDILEVGAWGAGVLRSATALGALLGGGGAHPLSDQERGRASGCSPASRCSGVATIVFGLSTNLVLLGRGADGGRRRRHGHHRDPADPDPDADARRDARPRVLGELAVLRHSSQIGPFRAGVMAEWFGAVAAVVIGGAAVLGAVALWAWLFPALRRVDNPALVGQVDPMGDQRINRVNATTVEVRHDIPLRLAP